MISNQILQNTIEGLKGITRIDFCVMDTDGKSLAWLCRITSRQCESRAYGLLEHFCAESAEPTDERE